MEGGGGGGMKNSDLSVEELQIHHQSNDDDHHHHQTQDDDQYLLQQMLSTDLSNCSWPHDLILSNSSSSNPNPNPNLDSVVDPHHHQLLLPLSLAADPMDPRRLFAPQGGEGAVEALYNGFAAGPLNGNGGSSMSQQPFEKFESKGGGGSGSASTGTGGGRQRVRARRGQATDPHSIAERLRRERIAERMKGLQQLVPNANKTDKASMLDEIIDYVKFLQVQVKVLSMSRLGGRPPLPPLLAGLASEGGSGGGIGPSSNGAQEGGPASDSMAITEQQVIKLMEEDMGSAMQYLQGKGLCLMPISLATAISTATTHQPSIGGGGRSSPSVGSVLTANLVNGDGSVKDSTPNPKA